VGYNIRALTLWSGTETGPQRAFGLPLAGLFGDANLQFSVVPQRSGAVRVLVVPEPLGSPDVGPLGDANLKTSGPLSQGRWECWVCSRGVVRPRVACAPVSGWFPSWSWFSR